MPQDPLHHLGEFGASLMWNDIPAAVRHRAALALRDTIGTMYGGSTTRAARIGAEVAAADSGMHPIVGRDARASCQQAAFANALAASALDFDDGHYAGGAIHPASVIVSTLITAACDPQAEVIDLRALLVAQVVGYEIGLRAAHLLWPKHVDDDYHCTGTAATLGAAAALARLWGLDADGIARSIAIAWAHAPMATFQLPMVKESIGWSAATAVTAVRLARAGFMSMSGGSPRAVHDVFPPTPFHRAGVMTDPFVASLGTVFEAGNTYFKPYASCRYTHAPAAALKRLLDEHGISPDDAETTESIESIEVGTHRGAVVLADQRPPSLEHAQYSFPFVLGAIVLHGAAGAAEMNDNCLTDVRRLAFAERVTVRHDPAMDDLYPQHYAGTITVRTTDGSVVRATGIVAPGDPAQPMTGAELEAKFLRLMAVASVDSAQAQEISAAIMSPDAAGLASEVLGGGSGDGHGGLPKLAVIPRA